MKLVTIPNEQAESRKLGLVLALADIEKRYRQEAAGIIERIAEIDAMYPAKIIALVDDQLAPKPHGVPEGATYSGPGL